LIDKDVELTSMAVGMTLMWDCMPLMGMLCVGSQEKDMASRSVLPAKYNEGRIKENLSKGR
jgi:hypothetical protein